jgi:outer membrane protein
MHSYFGYQTGLRWLALGAFIWGLTFLNADAQDQKIGYVNTDRILSEMREYEGVQQNLKKLSDEWRSRLKELDKEIEEMRKEFEAKEILYTDKVRKEKKQQIQAKINERENYLEQKFGSDGEYFQKQQELLEPIQRKVMEAVNQVAQDKGFDYVFDRAGDVSLMFAREQWNLNEDVLIELGISVNDSKN